MKKQSVTALAGVVSIGMLAGTAAAQLRVATWNISNYAGGRASDLQTAIYASFEGRSMRPDVIVTQEFLSTSARDAFLQILNTAPGSPGDWATVQFIDGPDTDSAFFYRTTKVVSLGVTVVSQGGTDPQPPRNTYRYDFHPVGYGGGNGSGTIAWYAVHMKAGSSSTDQARRQVEAQRIRDDFLGTIVPRGWAGVVAGDFNVQSSNQAAYQTLAGAGAAFLDPIKTPGSWNNNSSFRFVHTQDPAGAGGMDDRHDQILISGLLANGTGLDYIGNVAVPYSTTTWDDPNHSYRAWGNDGTSFDNTLRVTGNTMVGASIAQSLITVCNGAGHLPIVLDMRVPAVAGATPSLNFGSVAQGSSASVAVQVWNSANATLWTPAGVDSLRYTLAASGGFGAPGGTFADEAGGTANTHTITIDTSTSGIKSGVITISSNGWNKSSISIPITGEVLPPVCPADFDGDGFVDLFDFDAFVSCFEGSSCPPGTTADFDNDGFVDLFDFDAFISAFESGC